MAERAVARCWDSGVQRTMRKLARAIAECAPLGPLARAITECAPLGPLARAIAECAPLGLLATATSREVPVGSDAPARRPVNVNAAAPADACPDLG